MGRRTKVGEVVGFVMLLLMNINVVGSPMAKVTLVKAVAHRSFHGCLMNQCLAVLAGKAAQHEEGCPLRFGRGDGRT